MTEMDIRLTVNGNPSYRYFVPVPLQPFCLNCHGRQQDNPLNAGKEKYDWHDLDMTGFEMENWQLGDFAGGVSVTIYKKDFLQLKEPCELDDVSDVACHIGSEPTSAIDLP